MGFPKGKPHRCLVLPTDFNKEHPHNKYWNESEKRYDFCVDQDGDGSVEAYFAYDFETMSVLEDLPEKTVENLPHPTPDEYYAVDLAHYNDIQKAYAQDMMNSSPDLQHYNLTGKIKRFQVNMVVCANIFSSSVPKNPGDAPYTPDPVVFRGENCVVKFIEYLMSYNKGRVYAFAHNGSGFDSKFIFEAVLKMQNLTQNSILRGSNFMALDVRPDGRGANRTYFLDSMLHLSGSLSALLDGYFGKSPDPNLRIRKGYFPHEFNTSENQSYVGPLPDIKHFGAQHFKIGSGKLF